LLVKTGVPRLFPWLVKNFPEAIKHFREGEFTAFVDYLYLDANGLLHGAAQEVFHYGDNKGIFYQYTNLSYEEKIKEVYRLFFEKLIQVTHIIKPRKVLYIAIDGPAPLAKQAQQRERRFVSARDRIEGGSKLSFDSNSITPGTTFMLDLTRYINYAIRKEMNSFYDWKNLNVYFSPATVPGEGEHKITDFIRAMPKKERESSSHCLFGPDADLIMLTLAMHLDKMFLFREDQYHPAEYDYLNMGMIRKQLSDALGQTPGVKKGKRNLNDVTNDFILEGFFVGNDFVPKIQMFHLLEEGLIFMLDTYATTSKGGTRNFLTIDNEFNLEGFQPFVATLSKFEEQYLIEQVTTTNPRKQPPEPKFRNETLLRNITTKVAGTAIKRTLNFQAYRREYYTKSDIDVNDEPERIVEMCQDYLRSFIWVIKYYVTGLPAWRWAYRWHYAPLMSDFSNYIASLSEEEANALAQFKKQRASLPFEQLLSVLPPTSAELLPKAYQRLMLNSDSPLVELGYYPDVLTFHIDYEGKLKEFQGVAILPFVNYDEIHKNYEHMTKCCVPHIKKYSRNKRGQVRVYWYNSSYTAKFSSDMGNISKLHVEHALLGKK